MIWMNLIINWYLFMKKIHFLIKISSSIYFLLKNLKLTFEQTRIYSLECLNSYDLNEEENNFEGERKTKARRLCHLTKETYPLSLLLSSSVWKREERVHAFCPCFSVDARSSWTLFPSDTTNTQQRFRFLSHRVRTRGPFNITSCYPIVREISHQLISAETRKLIRAFLFIRSGEAEFRNILEIFASTQRTDLLLGRANKFLPFPRESFENDRFKDRFDSSRK